MIKGLFGHSTPLFALRPGVEEANLQLGITSLSLSSRAQQGILRLF